MDLRLRPFRIDDEAQARAAHAELEPEGFHFLLGYSDGESWEGYLDRLERARNREGVAPGMVPATLLVAEVGTELVDVTCDEGNLGSITAIERCGGMLEDVVDDPGAPRKRRYWIA